MHFLRNLLSHVPKAGQDMVAAAMKAVLVIQAPDQVRAYWQRVTEMLRKPFPNAVPVMEAARDDVLAFLHFPQEHWRKVWSTNPLERLNKEIMRRTNVVGIFPNDAANGLRPTSSTPGWLAANCWSSRRNGSWSAGASSPRPPWPRSLSPRRRSSSRMDIQPIRRQQRPAEHSSLCLALHESPRSLGCTFSDQGSWWMGGAEQSASRQSPPDCSCSPSGEGHRSS